MTASKRGIKLDEWNITWDEYRELYYFCQQYARKKREADNLLTLRISTPQPVTAPNGAAEFMPHGGGGTSDPVAAAAEKRERLLRDVGLIEQAARIAGEELSPWLLQNVTTREGIAKIIANGCPCSMSTFYRMRRKFFGVLRGLLEESYRM